MKIYFKLEFQKNIFSLRTIIFILIILTSLVIPYLAEIAFPFPGLDGVDYYMRISNFSYIGFIGPVLAGLIYSTSIIKDKESGFINKLLEIINIKTYFKVKLAVNTLITFIVFAVSHGIFMLYLIIIKGVSNTVVKDIATGAFMSVYNVSKISYIILILVVISLSSAAFSIFVLGVITATQKKFIAYILLGFYVIATGILFEIWPLNNLVDLNVTKLFNLIMNNNTKGLSVIIYDLILMLLGVLLLYKFGYKRYLALYEEN
ncbi:hypothetical protein [Clostridium sp. FP1]|uniref:hypothetical protein n=1 Tax=Clostridium sp. FP1 TaxID=2724076 RepID=UPI0013E9190D|nr:hypothetical protein [Clostridium sp. FP1]MBZ9637196.1 hypothetical protein [Clostridium sp. FP1]